MRIQTEIVDGVVIITLSGRAEPGTANELAATVHRLLDDGHREFVLSLERVEYIDSAELGEIVRVYTDVSRRGGKLRLEGLNQRIRELLGVSKLTGFFDVSVDPFPNPINPRLDDVYWKLVIAAGSLVVLILGLVLWGRH